MIKLEFGGENPSVLSKRFWIKVLLMSLAILITCFLFPSLATVSNPRILNIAMAAVMISLLNAFLKPLLTRLSLPLILFSFGFFSLVINALIVMLTSFLIKGFHIAGFWDAFLFSIIITILAFILDIPEKMRKAKKQMQDTLSGMGNNTNQEFQEENNIEQGFSDYEDLTDKEEEEK